MNLEQQAELVARLGELRAGIEETKRHLFAVGFLDSFHFRQADGFLAAALADVDNAMRVMSAPTSPPPQ